MSTRGCIIGDSITATVGLFHGIDFYLLGPADVARGHTINNIATSGDSIDAQKTKWSALADKTSYDWVIVAVGANDEDPHESAATAIARYQSLIDTIVSDKAASCILITATLTPNDGYLIDVLGGVWGPVACAKWLAMNTAIVGEGPNAVTGPSARFTYHTTALSSSEWYLSSAYDSGDKRHPTNSGRMVIARYWKRDLRLLGFYNEDAPNTAKPYPWRL